MLVTLQALTTKGEYSLSKQSHIYHIISLDNFGSCK